MVLAPQKFRLEISKRAATVTGFAADEHGKPSTPILERNEERWERTPMFPSYYQPSVGTYEEMSAKAKKLNNIQLASGYLDFLYSVEPAEADIVPRGNENKWVALQPQLV